MKISYKWLKEYLPANDYTSPYINSVDKIAEILTAVGLEVESVEAFSSLPGNLEGLVIGEVLTCIKHPDADKLKVTTVSVANGDPLQIVCGAPNVAAGQKVVVATSGTTLYPSEGVPFQIKKAKIRGVESNGMLCAEDEIGLGGSHAGIIVLPEETKVGMPASEYFGVYTDTIFEIGLTPNRMDAQSHLGVAKDVCAWLSHHLKITVQVVSPLWRPFVEDEAGTRIQVEVPEPSICKRYSGVLLSEIKVADSPKWLQHKLKAIGIRPINNIVDITNFILHATGQPLHAFDADKIKGQKIIVETVPAKTPFVTLDGKRRSLLENDIMICDGDHHPMCIAGVFGGLESGVTENTTNIFLESAVFNGSNIRKSIFAHGLRTDAAVRFEKGVDISKTVEVLKYAALLMKELGGGKITSSIIDEYTKNEPRHIIFSFDYLKKLSGKVFDKNEVENILVSLGFTIVKKDSHQLEVVAPESNPDISLPADLVEEILRIDGLDNIAIPKEVSMTPGIHDHSEEQFLKERIVGWLTGNGFHEIFTNSLTNDHYFSESTLKNAVHVINSLSEELNIMRPQMLQTGLETIAFNINRQNKDLLFFEFGKTYSGKEGDYKEKNHLSLYLTGAINQPGWNKKSVGIDIYYVKGIAQGLLTLAGLTNINESLSEYPALKSVISFSDQKEIAVMGEVSASGLQMFNIKQPVFYLDINWDYLCAKALKNKTVYRQVSKFPSVNRDLSMVVAKELPYGSIENLIASLKLKKLNKVSVFDLYENEKLGKDKKSLALSFNFSDPGKTLTDKEIGSMMNQIMKQLSEKLNAEIRSHA